MFQLILAITIHAGDLACPEILVAPVEAKCIEVYEKDQDQREIHLCEYRPVVKEKMDVAARCANSQD